MKKILAIIGSPRKSGRTHKVVKMFEDNIKKVIDIDIEYAFLTDYNIHTCIGCELCLKKGEEYCPFNDDTTILFEKMVEADGIIIASPNYALQVSAITKKFLDRFSYVFHRPCFFHKAWIPIVVEGAYGAKSILKYLNTLGSFWGFNVCKGVSFTLPVNEVLKREKEKVNKELYKRAQTFSQLLNTKKSPSPSLKRLCMFRLVRTFHENNASEEFTKDYQYYKKQGWFKSQYYYDVNLGFCKKIIGILADKFALMQFEKNN